MVFLFKICGSSCRTTADNHRGCSQGQSHVVFVASSSTFMKVDAHRGHCSRPEPFSKGVRVASVMPACWLRAHASWQPNQNLPDHLRKFKHRSNFALYSLLVLRAAVGFFVGLLPHLSSLDRAGASVPCKEILCCFLHAEPCEGVARLAS